MNFDSKIRNTGLAWVNCPKNVQPLVGQILDAGTFGKVRVVAADQAIQEITDIGGYVISTVFMQPIIQIIFLDGIEAGGLKMEPGVWE